LPPLHAAPLQHCALELQLPCRALQHTPFWHWPAHGALHPPQCCRLVFVSTHAPPQRESAPPHTQELPWHVAWNGHALPHPPQLAESTVVSTHPPPHGVFWQVHRPPAQA
jgi:hypothetical protein